MEFFQMVREDWPAVQVIILTGYGDLESARAAIRLGVADFLSKPCHLRDLEMALDRARRRITDAPAPAVAPPVPGSQSTLADTERQQILAALQRNGGNRTAAAAELGISRRTLHYRLNEYRQQGHNVD
jgi:DNA-binding NtrC family response regulator